MKGHHRWKRIDRIHLHTMTPSFMSIGEGQLALGVSRTDFVSPLTRRRAELTKAVGGVQVALAEAK